jgi:hypothetical protein
MTEWLCKRSFLQAFSVVITFGSSTGGSGSSTEPGATSVVVMRSGVHSVTGDNCKKFGLSILQKHLITRAVILWVL